MTPPGPDFWVAVGAIVSPVLVVLASSYSTRSLQRQTWAREDAREIRVAGKVQEVADQTAKTEQRLATKVSEVADAAAVVAERTDASLEKIHVQVNSSMTSAMQSELSATLREFAMMHEVVALKKVAGHEATPEVIRAMAATEVRINELQAAIDSRKEQTKLADSIQTP